MSFMAQHPIWRQVLVGLACTLVLLGVLPVLALAIGADAGLALLAAFITSPRR